MSLACGVFVFLCVVFPILWGCVMDLLFCVLFGDFVVLSFGVFIVFSFLVFLIGLLAFSAMVPWPQVVSSCYVV